MIGPSERKSRGADRRDLPVVSYANPEDPFLRRASIGLIETLTGKRRIKGLYHAYHLRGDKSRPFWSEALRRLEIDVSFDATPLAQVPRVGPLVVVANHPFGVIDGIILCDLVAGVRADFKILAHEVLYRAPEVRGVLLPVSFTGTREARQNNVDTCRSALGHVRLGGALIIFPAGGVSTARRVFGRATDLPWKLFAAKLITASRATVLPVCFEGQNSWMFHAASHIGETYREALLIKEAVRRIGSRVHLRIGTPLPFDRLRHRDDPQALLDSLRAVTYGLLDRSRPNDTGGGWDEPFEDCFRESAPHLG